MRWLCALWLAGCTSFAPPPCGVRCSDGRCPGSAVCGSDGFCHAGDEVCAGPDGGPQPGAVLRVHDVALGKDHACAISDQEEIYCWGSNARGQLGIPDPSDQVFARKVTVPGLGVPDQLAVGDAMSCVRKNGNVWCWGDDGLQQLGQPTQVAGDMSAEPLTAYHSPARYAFSLVAGRAHVCLLADSDDVMGVVALYCWGDDAHGQSSLRGGAVMPATVSAAPAQSLIPETGLFGLRAGDDFTCLDYVPADTGRQVACWGDDSAGQLDGVPRASNLGFTQAYPDMCGVLAAGGRSLACAFGQQLMVRGELAGSAEIAEDVEHVALGEGLGCYVTRAGRLRCWGEGSSGVLGPEVVGKLAVNQAVVILDRADDVYVGPGYACARAPYPDDFYALSCWGGASHGRLGGGIAGDDVVIWPPGQVYIDARDLP